MKKILLTGILFLVLGIVFSGSVLAQNPFEATRPGILNRPPLKEKIATSGAVRQKIKARAKALRKNLVRGTVFGTISSLGTNSFVMETLRRGTQNVTLTSESKLVNRRMETIIFSDIKVGHRVRVRGLWNNKNNTITEVVQVKDFSLPPLPEKPTATPSASPTP